MVHVRVFQKFCVHIYLYKYPGQNVFTFSVKGNQQKYAGNITADKMCLINTIFKIIFQKLTSTV